MPVATPETIYVLFLRIDILDPSKCVLEYVTPVRTIAKGINPTATWSILDEGSMPQLPHLPARRQPLHLPEHVVENRTPASLVPSNV